MYSKERKESQVAIVGRDPDDYYYDYELGESSSSSKEGSIHELAIDYHRSSTSSSSDGSGKQLVRSYRPSSNNRPTRGYHSREERYYQTKGNRRDSSPDSPSPEFKQKPLQKFFIGSSSTPPSSRDCPSPLRLPASPLPLEMFATPKDLNFKRKHMLHPYNLQLHPGHLLMPPKPHHKSSTAYEPYWYEAKSPKWCIHEECLDENRRCADCQMKEEIQSNCSSVNPPPTFTAMDNYRPVRKKNKKCSCGAISAVTTAFSTLVLVLIAAFILYTEMVLKKSNYIPEPM